MLTGTVTEDDDFSLDLGVLVAMTPDGFRDCSTDDGCGNTCSGSDSSCNSFTDDPS